MYAWPIDAKDGELSDYGSHPILPISSTVKESNFSSDPLKSRMGTNGRCFYPFSGSSIPLSYNAQVVVVADSPVENSVVKV